MNDNPMTKIPFYTLTILTLCNTFNYIDRNIFNSLAPVIKTDLNLNHLQIGLLASAFNIVYVIACPVMGTIGDKYQRPRILSVAVFFWSIATSLAGFARGFWSMAFARSAVGIGEAAYSSIGPSLVEDCSAKEWKSRAMAVFLLALPVGSALGYLLGGVLHDAIGWRHAFIAIGGPGVLLAVLSFNIREPNEHLGEDKGSFFLELKNDIWDLLQNRVYMHALLGYTAFTFVVGGMSVWMPEIMVTAKNMSLKNGNMVFGGITVVSGILGTFIGAFASDKLLSRTRRAPIIVCTVSLLFSVPFAAGVLFIENHVAFFTVLFICEVFLFINTSPITIVILEAVSTNQRSVAMGVSVLVIHALGDAISPTLIGWLADLSDIITASSLLPTMLVVGVLFWALCSAAQGKE
jgi:predicted MFS family arabinose efflux permease